MEDIKEEELFVEVTDEDFADKLFKESDVNDCTISISTKNLQFDHRPSILEESFRTLDDNRNENRNNLKQNSVKDIKRTKSIRSNYDRMSIMSISSITSYRTISEKKKCLDCILERLELFKKTQLCPGISNL